MTQSQAAFKARQEAKKSVKRYFDSEPKDTFNWQQYGSKIIKKELHEAFKIYVPHFNIITRKWCVVLLHGNKIVEE